MTSDRPDHAAPYAGRGTSETSRPVAAFPVRILDFFCALAHRPARTIAALAALFLGAYVASLIVFPKPGGRIVMGDAAHYYVYLRSAVFDHDLQFQNDYVVLYGLAHPKDGPEWLTELTSTGHVRNFMSVGPAVVWAPLYLTVTAGVWVSHLLGGTYPLDGFGRVFQASAGVSGILAAGGGVWLAFRAAAILTPPATAFWAAIAVWLGSSAVYYSLISPTYSHAVSMLTSGAFVLAWIATAGRRTWHRYVLLGCLAGASALVRWQDLMLLAAPVTETLLHPVTRDPMTRWPWTDALSKLAILGATAALTLAPQLVAWHILYGTPLLIPQGDTFMRWGAPALGEVLFSDYHGLLSWTPLLILSIAGFALRAARDRIVVFGSLTVFLLAWYANAAAADWWAGEAFGARRFVSLFPLFVLGLAFCVDRFRTSPRAMTTLVIALVAANVLLLFQYQLFLKGWRDIAPYPGGIYGLFLARFVVPFQFLTWLWNQWL
jgi:hypothetical protein